ncbi:MAG: hypothetical protein F9K23_01000 [Bacteroidetes bacterium]|nr:MAG: hypothetical protein F9K23_01000 [Bacteroidota bacterium]
MFIPVLSETQFAIKSSKEKPDVVKNFYEYLNLSSTLEANGSEFIELTSSMNGLRLQEEILEVFNMSIRYGDFYIAYSRPNVTNYLISKFSKAETNMISFHYHLDYDELEFVLEELELKSEVLKFYSNLTSLIDNLKLDSKRLDSIAQNLIGL